jgi:hypothetical protein
MTTIVLSNGHLRTETIEAAIDALIEMLNDHPLNRLFEKYGDFVERDARNLRGEWLEGWRTPSASSATSSTAPMSSASSRTIRITSSASAPRSRQTASVPTICASHRPTIPTSWLSSASASSTTQGEVLLTYDSQRVEQYGDTIRLNGRGNYEGHDDHYWHNIAKRDLARRHVEAFDRSMTAREALPPT